MSRQPPAISDIPPAESRTWNETWTFVLSQPSVGTFQEILEDPKASNARAYLWVFVSALVGSAIATVVNSLFNGVAGSTSPSSEAVSIFISTLLALFIGTPILALFITFLFVDGVLLTQFIARKIGGTGTSRQMMWATAAYLSPLILLSTALSALAAINWTALLCGLYGLLLNWMAIQAVNRLSRARALVVALSVPFLLWIIASIILILLGPQLLRPGGP